MKIHEFILRDYKGINYIEIKKPSDIVVLIGPNGSGKSTILYALNEALSYCFGYIAQCSEGIELVLDFTDDQNVIINSIEKIQNDLLDDFRQYINETSDFLAKAIKDLNELFIEYFSNKPIIKMNNQKFYLSKKIKYEKYLNFCDFVAKNHFSKNHDFFLNIFIHKILKLRSQGNQDIPGIVFLNTEKGTARNSTFNISQAANVKTERIRKLNDQDWRTNTLGARLVSLILKYSKLDTTASETKIINPINRINQSLRSFLPYLCLISPIETDNKLKFKVRDKELTLDQLSSGEITLINFAIDYLEIELNNGILIIDEPGAHLHYNIQKRIIKFLKDLTEFYIGDEKITPQIWIATHSPAIINSLDSELIYIVNIDDEKSVVRKWESDKKANVESNLLNILGLNQFFKVPILYLEGESDKDYLERIISKLEPKLLVKWNFEYLKGSENIDQIIQIQNNLEEKTKSIKLLQAQLKQNHFLKDKDNKDNQIKNENTYIWNFYHIENLLYLNPWFEILKKVMKFNCRANIDVDLALEKAIKEVATQLKMEDPIDLLITTNSWQRKLPGRELLKRWNKYCKCSLKIEKALELILDESHDMEDFPIDLIEFIEWLQKKFDYWSTIS